MDVQDLVLQWVFLRSFEARPQLTTYFIQFLSELLKRYAGANLMMEAEKNLLICSALQLYITCYRYVDASYFSLLFQLTIQQTGCTQFLSVVDWQLRENKIVEEFHMDQVIDILQMTTAFISTTEVQAFTAIWRALIDFCYNNLGTKQPITTKCLRFLAILCTLSYETIESLFNEPDDQVLVAVRHLIEQGVTPVKGQVLNTKNEVIEEPGEDPLDNSDMGDRDDDVVEMNPELLAQRGQVDSFLNNFLRADESLSYKYMLMVKQWIDEPEMEEILIENINDIIGSLITHFQRICGNVEISRLRSYMLIVHLLGTMGDNEHIAKSLSEKVCFELFDTMLFILIHTNEAKNDYDEDSEAFQGLTKLTNNLNVAVLKFISKGEQNLVYLTLFDLLIKCRESYVPSKFDGLVVKCIVKVTQAIDESTQDLELGSLLLKMHQYMVLIRDAQVDKKDDIGVKIIKTVLNAIIEKFDDRSLLLAYRESVSEFENEDNSIKKWMHMIMQSKKTKDIGSNNRMYDKAARHMPERSNYSSAYASNSNIRHKIQKSRVPEVEPEEEHAQDEADELEEIREITSKFAQPGLPLSQLPKILRELEVALGQIDQKVNIEPFLEGIDDKKKLFILREIKKYYTGAKNAHLEESERKSRLARSEIRDISQDNSVESNIKERATIAGGGQRTLRLNASTRTMGSAKQDQESVKVRSQATPSGGFNRSLRVPRAGTQDLDEQTRKIDELKKKMMNFK